MDQRKTCSKCGESKPASDFYRSGTGKYGVAGACKSCVNAASKEYVSRNKEKTLEYQAEYRRQHADEIKAQQAEYVKRNAQRIKSVQAAKYRKNPEPIKAKSRAAYYADPESWKRAVAEWVKANPDKRTKNSRRHTERHREAINAKSRARLSSQCANLDDYHIKRTLNQGAIVRQWDIPQELIDAKREHLRLLRLLKEKSK